MCQNGSLSPRASWSRPSATQGGRRRVCVGGNQRNWSSFSLEVREGKRKVVGLNPQGGGSNWEEQMSLKVLTEMLGVECTWTILGKKWEIRMGSSELRRCDDKAQDGLYARSVHVRLIWFIIVCSTLAFSVNTCNCTLLSFFGNAIFCVVSFVTQRSSVLLKS